MDDLSDHEELGKYQHHSSAPWDIEHKTMRPSGRAEIRYEGKQVSCEKDGATGEFLS